MKFLILAFITSMTLGAAAAADLPGTWTKGTYSNDFGSRDYYTYVPQNRVPGRALPVVIMLHACTQTAPDFAAQTGMNSLAENYGFVTIYPEQDPADNNFRCWNWFKPENQVRGGGEMGIVLGMLKTVAGALPVDTSRVYVIGFSAGGAMAANLIACHSDIFAGAGIHSGLEFRAATSSMDAQEAMAMGPNHDLKQIAAEAVKCTGPGAKIPAIAVIQGNNDQIVNPVNSGRILTQMTLMDDLIDDGQFNQSQNSSTPISVKSGAVPGGHQFVAQFFGGNGIVHSMRVVVDGMKHAWSGAKTPGQYSDPQGPDASDLFWVFLSNYDSKR